MYQCCKKTNKWNTSWHTKFTENTHSKHRWHKISYLPGSSEKVKTVIFITANADREKH